MGSLLRTMCVLGLAWLTVAGVAGGQESAAPADPAPAATAQPADATAAGASATAPADMAATQPAPTTQTQPALTQPALTQPARTLKAFPGAGGYGMFAQGGRGGDVYHVTTLEDRGPGSLREGLDSANGPRTIVFDVSGTIHLGRHLKIGSSFLTVAGQTAPGKGIILEGDAVLIAGCEDVIVRHLRVRPGDANLGRFTGDAMSLNSVKHVIVDHCSASWGVDENLSCAGSFSNVTVQNCIIAEGLRRTQYYHGKLVPEHKGHSMGSLIKPQRGDGSATYHHNLWAMNNTRNPAVGSYRDTQTLWADIRNNVVYNCGKHGYNSGLGKRIWLNYVGNCLIAGPDTSESHAGEAFVATAKGNLTIFARGNRIDTDQDGQFDGIDTGWDMIAGDYLKADQPIPMPAVDTQDAPEALQAVLAGVGAIPWDRDPVDQRIVDSVRTGTGRIIDSQTEVGGYVELEQLRGPADSDGDGMSDEWERAHPHLDANVADNNGDPDGDGYTNLEDYLNYLATPPELRACH